MYSRKLIDYMQQKGLQLGTIIMTNGLIESVKVLVKDMTKRASRKKLYNVKLINSNCRRIVCKSYVNILLRNLSSWSGEKDGSYLLDPHPTKSAVCPSISSVFSSGIAH